MSHVRDRFRAELTAAAAPVPFYETIGKVVDLNKAADLWVTIEFPLVNSTRIALGYPACYRESGIAIVHVVGRSGQGETAVIDFAEGLRPHFEVPYLQDIRMTGTSPPALIPTDDGEWLDATVPVGYEFDYVMTGQAVT